MKYNTKYFLGIIVALASAFMVSCSDFDEINQSPSAAGKESMHPDYLLSNSFRAAQQNPNDNERVFVYNWASISRVIGDNSFGAAARYSDEYNGCLYSFSSSSIKTAMAAINLVDESEEAGLYTNDHDKAYNNNVKQIARIWSCMVIADFVDCFGPYPLNAFQGTNPTFNSVEDVYKYMISELADAQAKLVQEVEISAAEAKQDPAFKMDPAKWQKLANSLRMRYAMRLSEVAASYAKTEFEAAAATKKYLTEASEVFAFPEYGGWSDWECVYNRGWDDNVISSTMVNILSGLGGVKVADSYNNITGSTLDIAQYIKPMNYIGIEYKNHYPEKTDNPMNYQWLDGVPENVDPRAFVYYTMPNDPTASTYHADKAGQTILKDVELDLSKVAESDLADVQKVLNDYQGMRASSGDNKGEYIWGRENSTMTFNGALAGVRPAWNPDTYTYNYLHYYCWDTSPFLSKRYNEAYANNGVRVWFGSWETYFLLAEAAVRGWNAGIAAETAYNNGIKVDFDYLGIGAYADAYINSEGYNRVGTSVKFSHTAEPANFEASYYDGYENVFSKRTVGETNYYGVITGRGALKTKTYKYPDASKILYKGHKLNDQITKIITQKYIANTPYGVVEQWNDRRRLGLPFFEVPGAATVLTGSDYDNAKTYDPVATDVRTTGQKWGMFTQRMRYPVSLQNADPDEYQNALQLLGGENTMMTPLWWSMK